MPPPPPIVPNVQEISSEPPDAAATPETKADGALADSVHAVRFENRLAFSVAETAQLLGVSTKTVRRLVARGLLRPSRALRHLRLSKAELLRFLKETSVP
jgi:excisionase family DNA binding protein